MELGLARWVASSMIGDNNQLGLTQVKSIIIHSGDQQVGDHSTLHTAKLVDKSTDTTNRRKKKSLQIESLENTKQKIEKNGG